MTHRILKGLAGLAAMSCLCLPVSAQTVPAPPSNVKSSTQGCVVTLTWENSDLGEEVLSTGFEEDTFPAGGWSVKTTDVTDPCFTWFQYPAPQYLEAENYKDFIFNGDHSAFVNFDMMTPRPAGEGSARQDEWLISPALENAAYVVFNFYINPRLLIDGAYDEFPNDYQLMVSRDGGESWEELWNARYDMLNVDAFQQAVVCLGEPCDNMKVAFVAVSDPDTDEFGLFYSWAVDDVTFYSDKPAAEACALPAKRVPAFAKNHHSFDTSGLVPSKACVERRLNSSVVKAPLAMFYNVYRDNQLIGSNIHTLLFADEDSKPKGKYVYNVCAVNEEGESEPAVIEVEITDTEFAMPRNLNVSATFNEDDVKYELYATWEAPDSDYQPSVYSVYTNDKIAAYIPAEEALEFRQSQVLPGTYKIEVEANYANPEGVSPRLAEWISMGARSTVTGISGKVEDGTVTLTWGEPTSPDKDELEGYIVYRSTDLVAEKVTEPSFTDTPGENALYRYTVICAYTDGSLSSPAHTDVAVGEMAAQALPSKEDFNGLYLPKNWQSTSNMGQTPDEYIFRFDNPFEIEVDGDGFEGGFASADNTQNPYIVATFLTSPLYDVKNVASRDELVLKFAYDFLGTGMSRATVQYSVDRGENWQDMAVLEHYTEQDLAMSGDFCMPKWFEYNFSKLAVSDDIMFRVYYESYWDKHIAIDSWEVTDGVSGVDAVESGIGVRVAVSGGVATVSADEEIISVAAYDVAGKLLSAVNPQGARSASIALPGGVAIIKAVTATGAKTVKVVTL